MRVLQQAKRALRNARNPAPVISEARGVRSMHIGGEAVQSAMRLDDPYALALDYTRCMMAFLLFHPQPREALMIGLGGGSLAKFFHRRLRGLRTRIVEIDTRVIDLARSHFQLPADDARLRVELGCGTEALAPECCDLLVIDGFVDESLPGKITSQAFFDAAWLALAPPGVLVMNLMDDAPEFDRILERLEQAFGGAVICMPALTDPNVIAFALKGGPERFAWRALRERASELEARLELPFPRYVSALRRMNRSSADALLVAPAG